MRKNYPTTAWRKFSRAVRAACPQRSHSCPIEDVDGFSPPTLKGDSFYFTNKSGDIIHHPNAYRRAWGKPVYNCSTMRIEVGRGWLIEQGLDVLLVDMEAAAAVQQDALVEAAYDKACSCMGEINAFANRVRFNNEGSFTAE